VEGIGVKLRKKTLYLIIKSPSFPLFQRGITFDSPLWQRGGRGDFPINHYLLFRIIVWEFFNLTPMGWRCVLPPLEKVYDSSTTRRVEGVRGDLMIPL